MQILIEGMNDRQMNTMSSLTCLMDIRSVDIRLGPLPVLALCEETVMEVRRQYFRKVGADNRLFWPEGQAPDVLLSRVVIRSLFVRCDRETRDKICQGMERGIDHGSIHPPD